MVVVPSSSPPVVAGASSYRMPGEWSPHSACLILYPHNPFVFRSDCKPARDEVKRIAQAIALDGQEDVVLLCSNESEASILRRELILSCENQQQKYSSVVNKVKVRVCPSDDSWVRDTGPTFVMDERKKAIIGIDWSFNAYGGPEDGCYWPCELDRKVASTICHQLNVRCLKLKQLVLEGGSIHTDGEGTLLTTEECLLHPNRNPELTKAQIESTIMTSLGCKIIIWLPFGLAADNDTNGHVDNMACFVRPGHIALSWCDDKALDPDNYQRCRLALNRIEEEVDAQGRNLTVHKLYLPPPIYFTEEEVRTLSSNSDTAERSVGERLAASYINFYIANKAVIVPQFGIKQTDEQALITLQHIFPDRKVVGVPSREILLGGGNIHCITQQVPLE